MAVMRYEVKAKNGSYKDRNGQEKTRWHQMGVCFQSDEGHLSIKIDSTPVNWDGWISLFEPTMTAPIWVVLSFDFSLTV